METGRLDCSSVHPPRQGTFSASNRRWLSIYTTRVAHNHGQVIVQIIRVTGKRMRWGLLLVIIFSDCGDDLASSPTGPWLSDQGPPEFRLLPTPKHDGNMSWETASWQQDSASSTDQIPLIDTRIRQSLSDIHVKYGENLDKMVQAQDPFYLLYPLFQQVAFAESQMLDLVDAKIKKHDVGVISSNSIGTIDNETSHSQLLHFQGFLGVPYWKICTTHWISSANMAVDRCGRRVTTGLRKSLMPPRICLGKTSSIFLTEPIVLLKKIETLYLSENEPRQHRSSEEEHWAKHGNIPFYHRGLNLYTSLFYYVILWHETSVSLGKKGKDLWVYGYFLSSPFQSSYCLFLACLSADHG